HSKGLSLLRPAEWFLRSPPHPVSSNRIARPRNWGVGQAAATFDAGSIGPCTRAVGCASYLSIWRLPLDQLVTVAAIPSWRKFLRHIDRGGSIDQCSRRCGNVGTGARG